MESEITSICLMTIFISFLGFLTENIWLALTKGYIDNRNMHLPFLLGYGIMVLLIYSLFGTPENKPLYFLACCILVNLGEIALGSLTEKICHFEWWNYLRLPLHITKYTSIPTTILFAAIITGFMDSVFLPLWDFFCGIANHETSVVAVILIAAITIDTLHSFVTMYHKHGLEQIWRINLSPSPVISFFIK